MNINELVEYISAPIVSLYQIVSQIYRPLVRQIVPLVESSLSLLTTFVGVFAGAFSAYWLDRYKEKKRMEQKYKNLLILIKDQLEQSKKQLEKTKKGTSPPPYLWTTYYNEINYSDLLYVTNISLVKHIRNIYGCIVYWNELVTSFNSPTGVSAIRNPNLEIRNLLMNPDPDYNYISACEAVIKAIGDFIKE
ncbi:hypothetical protein N9A72_00450 [bacterium]|nr:hypothetical protein [bacterium]